MVATVSMVHCESAESSLPILLTVKQVAILLGVSERHVYRLADGGLMPSPLKLGRINRWPKVEIDAWLKAGAKPVKPYRKRGA